MKNKNQNQHFFNKEIKVKKVVGKVRKRKILVNFD